MKCVSREDINPAINAARPQICSRCGRPSMAICDWRTGGGITCDALMCERHSYAVGINHYCQKHRKKWEARSK